jgi:hypothetical protein
LRKQEEKMDIFDILDNFLDDLENGVGLDYVMSNHGELVDEYADGDFTVEVYADGYTMRFCDRD